LKPSSTSAVPRPSVSNFAYPLPDDALALTRQPLEIPSYPSLGARSPGASEFSLAIPESLATASAYPLPFPSPASAACSAYISPLVLGEQNGLPDIDTPITPYCSSPGSSQNLGQGENILAREAVQQPQPGTVNTAANSMVSTGMKTCGVCGERFIHNFKLK